MSELPSISCSSLTSSTYESSSGSDGSYPSRRNKVEGYDYEFVPSPDARYECAICLLVLREPRQTPCGHRFCRDCIIKWIRESQQRCPVDNEPFEEKDLFADNFAKREIQNFNVRCPNSKQGCDVITTVKQLQTHQRDCPFGLVPCPNRCSNVLLKRDLSDHIQHVCELRKVCCVNCGATYHSRDAQAHAEVCPKKQVKCQFCEVELEMQAVEDHEATVCPKKKLHCAFYTLGCDVEMERCQEKMHLQDSMQEHMLMLCNGLTTILHFLGIQRLSPASASSPTRGLIPTEMSGSLSGLALSLQQMSLGSMARIPLEGQSVQPKQTFLPRLSGPTSSFVEHSSQAHEEAMGPISFFRSPSDPKNSLMGSAVSFGTQEASVLSHISGLSNSSGLGGFHSLAPSSSEDFESLKARNLNQDASLARHDQFLIELQAKAERCDLLNRELKQKVKQLEAQVSEFESRVCNGQFFWRIKSYSKLLRDAEHGEVTALHSQPFYSSASMGYKMCVRANLNGVDSARGSHLSLFIHFMQGEYDDILDWPFSGKIILSVIDQNEHCEMRQHVSETLMAKPNLAAFQKPTTPRNHKGFGYMEFLPLSALKNSSYIRNDTLIIKAQVLQNG